jgi:hypothetical protein
MHAGSRQATLVMSSLPLLVAFVSSAEDLGGGQCAWPPVHFAQEKTDSVHDLSCSGVVKARVPEAEPKKANQLPRFILLSHLISRSHTYILTLCCLPDTTEQAERTKQQ